MSHTYSQEHDLAAKALKDLTMKVLNDDWSALEELEKLAKQYNATCKWARNRRLCEDKTPTITYN